MRHWWVLWLAACIGLVGCGGGGGGGLSISFSASSLEFSGVEGAGVPAKTIVAKATGDSDDPIFVGAEVIQGTALELPIQVVINEAASTADIVMRPRQDLVAGTYSGRVKLMACLDANCARHHAGSPFEVSYSVVITPRLAFNGEASVALAAAESASVSRAVSVQLPASGATLSLSVSYQQGSGWLSAQQSAQGVTLTASAAGLQPGTYNAQLLAQASSQQASLPVQLTVSRGLVLPAVTELALTTTTPAQNLMGSVTVEAASGVSDTRWQARSGQGWLELTSSAGVAGQALGWRVVPDEAAKLPNGQLHSALITVTSVAGLASQTVEFKLNKQLAEIDAIDSLALLAQQPGELLLFGRFAQLPDPSAYVRVQGVQNTQVQRVSDSLLRLSMPALLAGTYGVTMGSASGIATRSLDLKVLSPRNMSYAAVPTAGAKGPVLFDPVTGSVLTINRDLSSLMRFGFDAGQWAVSAVPMNGVFNIGMTTDRSRLVVLNRSGVITTHDPASLQVRESFSAGPVPYDAMYTSIGLPVTGDGRVWYGAGSGWNSLESLNVRTGQRASISGIGTEYTFYQGPWGVATQDGRHLLLTQSLGISSRPPMLGLDLADGVLRTQPAMDYNGFTRIGMSRNGSRRASLDTAVVYDAAWQTVGRITLPTNWTAFRVAVSRDGSRTYVYAQHDSSIGEYAEPSPVNFQPRVFVLDSSQVLVTQLDLPVLGFFDLQDYPSCRVRQAACEAYGTQMALSDDDRTLFLMGDRFLVVQPVAPEFRSFMSTAVRTRPADGASLLRRLR
jgi:hypothetical protein